MYGTVEVVGFEVVGCGLWDVAEWVMWGTDCSGSGSRQARRLGALAFAPVPTDWAPTRQQSGRLACMLQKQQHCSIPSSSYMY